MYSSNLTFDFQLPTSVDFRLRGASLGPHWKAAKSALNRIPIKNFTEESEAETKPIPVPITSVRSAPEEPSSDEIFSIVKSEITSDSDIKSVSLAIGSK